MDTTILTVLNKIGEIGRFAVGEYQSLQDVGRQVQDLGSALEIWMAWIRKMDEGNVTKHDELVSVQMKPIRGAVFKAEDIVDEYFQGVYYSRPGLESREGGCSCVPCFPLSEVPLRYALRGQIQELLVRLEELKKGDSLFDMQPRMVTQANNIEGFDKPTMGTLAVQQLRYITFYLAFPSSLSVTILHL